jgi:CRP/FNR family transcriptional regulator
MRKTALFGELGDRELQALSERAVEQKLARNEILFLAGDAARGLYVIVEGAVRAFRVGPDGREQVIHIEREGATVGEVPMFDGGSYPSTVAAEEDSRLLFLARSDVQGLCCAHPQIAMGALRVLARRLRSCAALVETLSLHDVDRRLARLLLAEARAAGALTGNRCEFELALTHQQIATRIGSVREVVSRAFGRLSQAGHVTLAGKRVVVPDIKALEAYVDG